MIEFAGLCELTLLLFIQTWKSLFLLVRFKTTTAMVPSVLMNAVV